MTNDILKGLFIGLIIALATYRLGLAQKRTEKDDENRQKFREMISKEIAVLENGNRTNFQRFEDVFEIQKSTAIAFGSTLGKFRYKKFRNLWEEYESATANKPFVQPANCIGYTDHEEALSALKRLLKMTK